MKSKLTRREFLGVGGIGGLGALVSGCAGLPDMPSVNISSHSDGVEILKKFNNNTIIYELENRETKRIMGVVDEMVLREVQIKYEKEGLKPEKIPQTPQDMPERQRMAFYEKADLLDGKKNWKISTKGAQALYRMIAERVGTQVLEEYDGPLKNLIK